ncbi:MAG: lipoate--protein ligase family protein [Anaerolineae bacterium]|jgi:lipoate-protein ligase A
MNVQQSPSRYPVATWRLVIDCSADGATNMAIDEAIMLAVIDGASPPTLRFYGWSPPCLSLGRNQPLADVDQAACRAAGVDVVRRPTGGRAILHTDELTYSVILPQSDPRAEGGVTESYRRLSEGLLAGLHLLGVEASRSLGRKPSGDPSAVCFEVPSDYEIVVGARKLVGSAQWRSKGGVLQHGSLPLWGDLARIVDYLAFSEEERARQRPHVRARALTVQTAKGGQRVSFDDAAQAMAKGLATSLNLLLEPGGLSAQERKQAAVLRRGRYATAGWAGRT